MVISAQEQPSRSALLVVDVQEEFTRVRMDSVRAAAFMDAVNSAIEEHRADEVIFVQANLRALSISLKGIKVIPVGEQDLDYRLNRMDDDPVFSKVKSSAFTSDELVEYLEVNNIKHVYLSGLLLEACISSTAIEGVKKGYEVTVIKEAVISAKEEQKEKLLDKLEKKGVEME